MSDFISATEALKILDVSKPTLLKYCRDNKLKYRKVFHGKIECYEVDKDDCMKMQLALSGKVDEIPHKKTSDISQQDNDESIQKKIDALRLPQNEAERLKATLKGFTKSDAEVILKTEQALSKQKDNILRDGQYIEKSDVEEQLMHIASAMTRSLKDMIQVWQKRLDLSDIELAMMQSDLETTMKKTFDAVRQLCE